MRRSPSAMNRVLSLDQSRTSIGCTGVFYHLRHRLRMLFLGKVLVSYRACSEMLCNVLRTSNATPAIAAETLGVIVGFGEKLRSYEARSKKKEKL